MRRRKDESTPPTTTGRTTGQGGSRPGDPDHLEQDNAFRPELFDELRERDPSPATPEADLAGPWRVTRLWGDGPPLWACYGVGERAPRLTFEDPDLAYLAAAALALAQRRPRFHFEADDQGREHLHHDGHPVADTRNPHPPSLATTSLPTDLTRLHDLRTQPQALAHLLLATPDEVLHRAGTLFMTELRRTRQHEDSTP